MKVQNVFRMLVIMGAFMAFVAGNVYAATALNDVGDTDAIAPKTYANEIDVSSGGTTIEFAADSVVVNKLGEGLAKSENYWIRFDLSEGAEFEEDPVYLIAGTGTGTTSAGTGQSYAIFSFSTVHTWIEAQTGQLTVDADGLDVSNTNGITLKYSLYSNQSQASDGGSSGRLATCSAAYIAWIEGLTVQNEAITPARIDVSTNSTEFVTGNFPSNINVIGSVKVELDAAALWTDGAASAMADYVAAGTALVVEGDFTATQDLSGGLPDGDYDDPYKVWLSGSTTACIPSGGRDGDVTATTATITLDTAQVADFTYICMRVNEVSTIAEGNYTGLYDVTAGAHSSQADYTFGILSTLEKNGGSDSLNYMLNQDSSFPGLVKITNSGSTDGIIYITLINDEGTVATFELDDVDGYATSVLGISETTPYIYIQDLVDAAVEAVPTFETTGQYRVLVESTSSQVVVLGFSMSKDGSVFTVIDSVVEEAR